MVNTAPGNVSCMQRTGLNAVHPATNPDTGIEFLISY